MTSKLTTQKEMVEYLNVLRIENGKKPLKNCRASKKEVRLWILKETNEKLEKAETESEKVEKTEKVETEVKTETKKIEKAEVDAEKTEVKTITASELAKELGIDPKSLRRKLRKIEDDKLPPRIETRRWVFEISVKATLIDLLK